MILDTCYFIDAQRKPAVVEGISQLLNDQRLCTTVITCGELAAGFSSQHSHQVGVITMGVAIVGIDEAVAMTYGAIRRNLRSRGLIIGENDLWIAAIALTYDLPIVTRNTNEFSRVEGVEVVTY